MTELGALYNENEPYAVEWLRNLARAGHIAAGAVDPRDVRELRPDDVRGQRQVHFFAGLGGWSYALRLAGWPDGLPVWTGSCPCQPFSQSGERRAEAFSDERHLWPAWFNLIRECRPAIVFGEQVASPLGLQWLDVVFADLEGEDYSVGASDLPAAGHGAPHLRQRLFFVAITEREQLGARRGRATFQGQAEPGRPTEQSPGCGYVGVALGDTDEARSGRHAGAILRAETSFESGGLGDRSFPDEPESPGPWGDVDWVDCADGKRRAVEPGTFPLAHGVPARVGKLRAYGNAIVPQVAATFIRAARYAMIERQP